MAPRSRDDVTETHLGALRRTLDAAWRAGRTARRLPLWDTEGGVQTDPPDRILGVPPAVQARFLNQIEWVLWRTPTVRSVAQYLWRDERDPQAFQTGLRYADGRAKPALAAWRLPLHLRRTRAGRSRCGRGCRAGVRRGDGDRRRPGRARPGRRARPHRARARPGAARSDGARACRAGGSAAAPRHPDAVAALVVGDAHGLAARSQVAAPGGRERERQRRRPAAARLVDHRRQPAPPPARGTPGTPPGGDSIRASRKQAIVSPSPQKTDDRDAARRLAGASAARGSRRVEN